MNHSPPKQRKLFATHGRLQGKLANIRSGDERLFPRALQNQHAHSLVSARIQKHLLQLFHGLAVQRVQNLRPVEGNKRNPVSLLIQQILVSHLLLCRRCTPLVATTSSPLVSQDQRSHKIPARTSAHSIPPKPSASKAAAKQTVARETPQTYPRPSQSSAPLPPASSPVPD